MAEERKTYQGRPCKHGHLGARYRSSRQCVDCLRVSNRNRPNTDARRAGTNRRARKHRLLNSAVLNAKARVKHAADPEKARGAVRRNRLNNPERTKEHNRKTDVARRSAIAQSDENHTESDRALIFELQNGCCFYCGTPLAYGDVHGDHFIALSRGGSDAKHNIVMACPSCNLQKSAEGPVMFAFRKGFDPNRRPVFWNEL